MQPLTRAQVRAVDRIAIEDFHIPGVLLMENAARGFTDALRQTAAPADIARPLIVCGGGNNGGDGLAIARHLHNAGIDAHLALAIDPARYTGDAMVNWHIARAMGLPTHPASPELIRSFHATAIIDALFGTGLTTPPRDDAMQLILTINDTSDPVFAVDLPSGLDCDTGRPLGATCVHATRTFTFVAEKVGFTAPGAARWVGPLSVIDIGCPRDAIDRAVASTA